MKKNTSLNRFCLIILLGVILFIPHVLGAEFDNLVTPTETTKDTAITIGDTEISYKELWTKYPPVKVDNWLGVGETLSEGAILTNTESCGSDCSTEFYICNYEKDKPAISDTKFYRVMDNGEWIEWSVRSYQWYIKSGEEVVDVERIETKCTDTGKLNVNGTKIMDCVDNKIIEQKTQDVWTNYNYENIQGCNYYKLTGNKRAEWDYEFVPVISGKSIDEWATWGGSYSSPKVKITNGDFEYGNFTGWHNITTAGSGWTISTSCTNINKEGTYCANCWDGNDAWMGTLFSDNFTIGTAYNLRYWFDAGGGGQSAGIDVLCDGIIDINFTANTLDTNYTTTNYTGQIGCVRAIDAGSGGAQWSGFDYFAEYVGSKITLNSPANNYISLPSATSFNCTANIVGATFINKTLYTNKTGTWAATNTSTTANGLMTATFGTGNWKWGCRVCDSDGDCGWSSNRTLIVKDIVENSVSFTQPITETTIDTYSINVSSNLILSSVYLNYDGVDYSTTQSGDVYSKILTTPGVGVTTNKTLYWKFVYGGQVFNSSFYNQTITPISVYLCNNTYNRTLINFTTRDYSNNNLVNTTFKSTWLFSASRGGIATNYTYQDLVADNSSYVFCSNNNLTIYSDLSIEYDANGYAQNFYYSNDLNISTFSPRNVTLYLLNDSAATVTVLKVVDTSQTGLIGYIVNIQAKNVGTGVYDDVGMALTDYKGEDIVNLNWYDTNYRFLVYDTTGTLVKDTGDTKISATPTIIKIEDVSNLPYEKFNNFTYSLSFSNVTNRFTLTYTKPDPNIDEACLRVYKQTNRNNTLICNTCDTATTATIFCDVGSYGNGTYIGMFYATGSYSWIDWVAGYIGGTFQVSIYNLLGNADASFYAFLFAILVTIALFVNPVFGIIAMIFSLIGASALGFTGLVWIEMVGIIAIGGWIAWLIRK